MPSEARELGLRLTDINKIEGISPGPLGIPSDPRIPGIRSTSTNETSLGPKTVNHACMRTNRIIGL